MKLQDKQITDAIKGATVLEESSGLLCFNRFSKDIVLYYSQLPYERDLRAGATSGIRLDFISDTEILKITYRLFKCSTVVNYAAFDIWVDGVFHASLGEDVDDTLGNGCEKSIEATFGKGEKHITVYFPCLARVCVSSVEISDGASITPAEDKRVAYFFGDSITQGYTTPFPSLTYVSRLCRLMDWDYYNFGIGGDVHNGTVVKVTPDRKPDFVFTSYGTNDWGSMSTGALRKNMRDYYNALCEKYPCARIITILPIWREPPQSKTMCTFDELFPLMKDILSEFPRVEIIDGRELVPHVNGLFADGFLHPNETGFEFYANGIFREMSKL